MSSSALERLARLGFATKGVLYGLVGVLALQAAFRSGGATEDASGALGRINAWPGGTALLALVAAGLVGYSLWRFVQAAADPDHPGEKTGAKAVARRIGYAGSGLTYGALALVAGRGVWRGNVEAGGETQRAAALTLLGLPFGRGLLVALGLVLIGAGVAQAVRGGRASFMKRLEARAQTPLACWAGRLGLVARGLVFGLVGAFFVQAAWKRDAAEAAGTETALDVLGQASPWLFAAVAAGLVAFAVYCFIQARYRRIDAPALHV